jgi:putative transposase
LYRNLKVSESGYYRSLRESDKPRRDELLLAKIKEIIGIYPDNDNYGAQRVLLALRQRGKNVSYRTVYRVMKRNGLLYKPKHHPNGITREDAETQKSENLIRQDFTAEEPNKSGSEILRKYNVRTGSCTQRRSLTVSTARPLGWRWTTI